MLPRTQFIVLALLATLSQGASALERTELLPSGEMHLHITQAAQLWKDFGEIYGNRLRNDERFQTFSAEFEKKLEEKTDDGAFLQETRHLYEILKPLKGEIALVYQGDEKTYLAATATQKEFQQILNRTAWSQEQLNAPTVRKRSTFQGVEIVQETSPEKSYWLAWTRNTLLYGSEREWVEKSIVRLRKEEVEEPEESQLSCRFPIAQWIDRSLKNKEGNERVRLENLWNTLGILDIEQYLLEIKFKDNELIIDGTLLASNLSKGLFSLLDTAPEEFQNRWIVPDNASSFSFGKIDLLRFWNRLPAILKASPPKIGHPIFGTILALQRASGMNIEQDFLAHAGKKFSLSTVQIGTNQSFLVSLELNNGQAMEQSLATLFASPMAQSWPRYVNTSDFRGRTIHTQKSSDSNARPFALCVSGNHLLLGNAPLVRETILRQENGANPTPSTLQETARNLAPPTAFGFGAVDHQSALSVMQLRMSNTNFSMGFAVQSSNSKKKAEEELAENEISLDYITSFLHTTYHFAEAVPNGIHHRIVFEHKE